LKLGCVSGDHLECIDEESIANFSNSETVQLLLPGGGVWGFFPPPFFLGLGMKFTPCPENYWIKGACVAMHQIGTLDRQSQWVDFTNSSSNIRCKRKIKV